MEIEIKRKSDTIAQYVTIPRDIVMDSSYPLSREAESQWVIIKIDEKNKALIIKPRDK